MRTTALLITALLSAVPALAQCNRDNCVRAISAAGQSISRVSDCSTNLICTTTLTTSTSTVTSVVTPSSVTSVITSTPGTASTTTTVSGSITTTTTTTTVGTATVTSTITPSPVVVTTTAFTTFAKRMAVLDRRQNSACSANTVPAYAQACQNFARYSSACSCAGVTGGTTTVSTGVVTTTVTSTTTAGTVVSTVVLGQSTTTIMTTLAPTTTTITISASSVTVTSVTSLSASTTTTTSAVGTASATSCNNLGLQFAYYEDSQAAGLAADNSRYQPTVVKNRPPIFTGVTTNIGFTYIGAPPNPGPIYNTRPANGTDPRGFNYIVNHRGYLFTTVGGTYTLSVSQVDDVVDTWLDAAAYRGWTRFNSIGRVEFQSNPTLARGSGQFNFFLDAGQYIAFRVVFKQAMGDSSFQYTVTAPNGQVVLGPSSTGNVGAVQFGCDAAAAAAPMYPAFGSET